MTKNMRGEQAQKMTKPFVLSPVIQVPKVSPALAVLSCPEHFRPYQPADPQAAAKLKRH